MLECDIVVTELHAYDFVIKDFVVTKGIICVCIKNIHILPIQQKMGIIFIHSL